MEAQHILALFDDVAAEIRSSIHQIEHWGSSGLRPGQYSIDIAADRTAVDHLAAAGFGVLSEESGLTHPDREITVVVDPIDGSTNAAAGLPWFATSLCAIDADGPLVALVVNQATGVRWDAIRGGGAHRDGAALRRPDTARLSEALVAISGVPERHLGWDQFRCYGAAALDLCSVADGTFGAFADLSVDAHGVWDYAGAWLVVHEAGGAMVDRHDRDLIVLDPDARRTPIAAASTELLAELLGSLEAESSVEA